MYVSGGDRKYSRDNGTPSWEAFEAVVGALEHGSAVAFSSGMAACAAVVYARPWQKMVMLDRGYYATRALVLEYAREHGIECALLDTTNAAQTIEASTNDTLLWLENPSNPLLNVADLKTLIPAARERGAFVAVDNTFATPIAQQPLALGAHFSVHSATKYIAGHSDATIGIAIANDDTLTQALRHQRETRGAIPGAMETYLALRGVRTLPLRFERAQANAQTLAARLRDHSGVENVRYPGFGAMIAFEVRGGAANADAFCERVQLAVHATSLGGIETTLERRSSYAVESYLPPGFIRMSTGCEDVDDIWNDLNQALSVATPA